MKLDVTEVAVDDPQASVAQPRRFSAFRRFGIVTFLWWSALVLAIVWLAIVPLFRLQEKAFASGGAAFGQLFDIVGIGGTLWTTLVVGFGSGVFAIVLGTLLAWTATRLPRRGRRLLSTIPLVPLVIPAVAGMIGWSFLLSPNVGYINTLLRKTFVFSGMDTGPINVYSIPWIVILTGLNLTSFVFLFVNTALREMGDEYETAALVSGASRARAFFTVTLPLLRPSLVYASGTVILIGMGQFTAPLILGSSSGIDTLTTEMFRLTREAPINYGLGAALGTPLILLGIAVVTLQRLSLRNRRRFVTIGSRSRYREVEPRWWATAAIGLYGLFAVVLPILALVHVALSPFWTGKLTFGNLTLRNVTGVFQNPDLVQATINSIVFSLVALIILLPLGFLVAWAIMGNGGSRPIHRTLFDLVVQAPLAVPATLMGFALLFVYTRPPFVLYGGSAVIVITYITLMIPHTVRLQLSTMIALGSEMSEAARVSGAGATRTLINIVIPLARKGIASAAALMAVLMIHEFSASLLVRSPRTQVLGSVLYDTYIGGGTYPQVAVLALIMVVVTLIGVAFALAIAGTDSLESL